MPKDAHLQFIEDIDAPGLLRRELEQIAIPMEIVFQPFSAFTLAALLQLALRHPLLQASNRDFAERLVGHIREYFAESPIVLAILDQGDDPSQKVTNNLTPSAADLLQVIFAAAVQAVHSQTSQTAVSETRFLNLQQASAVSGLSPTYLKRQIKAGTLKAIKDRGWKIRRGDLEGL